MPKFSYSSLRSASRPRRSNPIHVILSKAKNLISLPSHFTLPPPRFPLPFGQRGQSSSVMVIIILVIIFAIMISGGAGMLFSGNEPSGDPWADTATPAGGSVNGSGSPGSGSGTTTPGWDITVTLSDCKQAKANYKTGSITVKGTDNGYIEYSVDNGGKKVLATADFTQPENKFNLILSNEDGVNNHNWKISVYSGGTKSGEYWSGGTEKKSYDGQKTGC